MSIKVAQLTKVFGEQKAVDNISFEIEPGHVVGFLGPNGAGKSTTMKILSGYIPQTSGKAFVCGFDVAANPMAVKRRLGYLPEKNPLYEDMYVREFLEFTAGVYQLGKQTKYRVAEMISRTGLEKEVKKKIGTLSKGYKQRVGLAQAMIHYPQALILDEPTSGLDPNQIVAIRELIKQISNDTTVLLSTHIMQEVQAMCSRAIIINNGKIVADDKIENIRAGGGQNAAQGLWVEWDQPISREQLSDIRHVVSATPADGKWLFKTLEPELLRKEIMQWSLDHDRSITSLQKEQASLEDTFRHLTDHQ
ncbi:MAG TPA: ATP-binding cassette domain-containing protein [Edaphocola sp.]|nr:ATP-binding cassette domain-containing protein [Edaphocola sp.]